MDSATPPESTGTRLNEIAADYLLQRAFVASFCLTMDAAKREQASATVTPGMISDTPTRIIYQAALAVHAESDGQLDPVAIHLQAKTDDRYDAASFAHLLDEKHITNRLNAYASELRTQSEKAVLTGNLREIASHAATGALNGELATELASLSERIAKIGQHVRLVQSAADGMAAFTDEFLRRMEDDSAAIFPTQFHRLNSFLGGGLKRGHNVVIGARPSTGKTTLGLNLAAHLAVTRRVLFISLEMSAYELWSRLLSRESHVPHGKVEFGRVDREDAELVLQARDSIVSLNLSIYDTTPASISEIESLVIREQPDVVIIDHLTLIEIDEADRRSDRYVQVGKVSKRLKRLARRTDACVIALAQLNREQEKQKNRKPTKADLRESGDIEQDADEIILIHEPLEEKAKPQGELSLCLEKQRGGAVGVQIEVIHDKVFALMKESQPNRSDDLDNWNDGIQIDE